MEFVRFGLIVTGKGEEVFLPQLFRSVMAYANCTFEKIRRSKQLSPITSEKRKLKIVGSGKRIPPIDAEEYGIPARNYLAQDGRRLVLVVDDVESGRAESIDQVFTRYRQALDEVLEEGEQDRAAVHFLKNMLEAYYFADHQAVNEVAGKQILERDYDGDVEEIRNPKSDLKQRWEGFHEIKHGKQIVNKIDIPHVLRHSDRCRYLRSMFSWCVSKLPIESVYDSENRAALDLGGATIPMMVQQDAAAGT